LVPHISANNCSSGAAGVVDLFLCRLISENTSNKKYQYVELEFFGRYKRKRKLTSVSMESVASLPVVFSASLFSAISPNSLPLTN
jgi:hypothetical protein